MTQSYKAPGKVLTLVAPYARASSGLGAKVGAIFGVSLDAVANAVEGEFDTEGVHELAKTSAQAWTQGQKIYWDDTNKRCDSDATVGMLIGAATAEAANPTATGMVKLNGVAPGMLEGAQAAIADVATADSDATYGAAESTLLNEIKTKFNTLLAELRLNGIIAP